MESLLFVRHAETDLAGRFCGHSDPPINERGHRQIEKLLAALHTESIDAIYSSDLSRAFVTADAIGRTIGLSPIVVPALREINFGEWEGLSWDEIEARDQSYALQWSSFYPDIPAPGGEAFAAFQSRVLTEVRRILALASPQSAVVVTHAGVMRVVLRSFCNLDEKAAWERTSAYCGIFRYRSGRLV